MSDETYDARVAHWRATWESIDPSAREGWRSPWLNESERDGNPIFSVWHPVARKAVRIVEHDEPGYGRPVWYMDQFGVNFGSQSDAVTELVFSCGRDPSATATFLALAESWLRPWHVEISHGPPEPVPGFEQYFPNADVE
jgi:hypothetical protein